MISTNLLKRNTTLSVFKFGNKSPSLVVSLKFFSFSFKIGIKLTDVLPEIINSTFKELIRYEKVLLHIFLIESVSRFAGKNDKFSDNILSAKVYSWVRLRVSAFLGQTYSLAQRNITAQLVENEIQCTAHNSLNSQNLVTTVDKVIDGIDYRKTGTYICLEQEFYSTLTCYLFQFFIYFIFRRCRNLIGSHNRNIMTQEILIKTGYHWTCSTIDKHRIEYIHADNLIMKNLWRRRDTFLFKFLTVILQINSSTCEICLMSVCYTYYSQTQTTFLHQFFLLTVNLLNQTVSYRTNTAYEKIQYLVLRQEKRIMDYVKRLTQ